MEVADEVVVMNRGKIEQVAGPRTLYDEPANEFVMSFVGPTNKLDGAWVRPHDVELRHEPNGSTREAQIERIVRLGFETRVELVRDDGDRHEAILLVAESARELGLGVRGFASSGLPGPKGNRETFVWCGGEGPTVDGLEAAIVAAAEGEA